LYPAGSYNVNVINPDASVTTSTGQFTFTHQPLNPTRIVPNRGLSSGGFNAVLHGTGFSPICSHIQVKFNDLPPTITPTTCDYSDPTDVKVTIMIPSYTLPSGIYAQNVEVKVTNSEDLSTTVNVPDGFTYLLDAFFLEKIVPNVVKLGQSSGPIKVYGNNFVIDVQNLKLLLETPFGETVLNVITDPAYEAQGCKVSEYNSGFFCADSIIFYTSTSCGSYKVYVKNPDGSKSVPDSVTYTVDCNS
jgi:hypothetical protein